MMMENRIGKHIIVLCILSLLYPGKLLGQQKDFQSWWEFSIDKGLKKGFDLSGEIEQRFRNNSLQYDRTLVTLSGKYKINDYLDVATGFRAYLANNMESQLNGRYRLHADARGKYTWSGYDLSFRLRLQYGFEDIFDAAFMGRNNFGNRNRLKVAHHIPRTRVGWFVSVDSWYLLNKQPRGLFYKMRFSAGAEYSLNFRSKFSFRYILEDEINIKNPMQSHILVFGYSHSL